MALNLSALVDAVTSHAMATGRFEVVEEHEPADQPLSGGLSVGIWVNQVTPVRSSGLDAVSVLVVLNVRLYTALVEDHPDLIDPALMDAVSDLYERYCEDFTLAGQVRAVDIFGAEGPRLETRAGYVTQASNAVSRIMTITLPLIVNDSWQEGSEG